MTDSLEERNALARQLADIHDDRVSLREEAYKWQEKYEHETGAKAMVEVKLDEARTELAAAKEENAKLRHACVWIDMETRTIPLSASAATKIIKNIGAKARAALADTQERRNDA